MDEIRSEVVRVPSHLLDEVLMFFTVKKDEAMLSLADVEACVLKHHDQSLPSVMRREVDLLFRS